MAKAGQLHYATLAGAIAGVCYVHDEDGESEFGGVCVAANARGTGLSDVLGAVAIGLWIVNNLPKANLIAHVHSRNRHPLRLLKRLGFEQVGSVTLPKAPDGMDAEPDGSMVGDVYHFRFDHVGSLAKIIEDAVNGSQFLLAQPTTPWPATIAALKTFQP